MSEVSPIVYLTGDVTKGTFRSGCPDRGIDLGVRSDYDKLIRYLKTANMLRNRGNLFLQNG